LWNIPEEDDKTSRRGEWGTGTCQYEAEKATKAEQHAHSSKGAKELHFEIIFMKQIKTTRGKRGKQ